MGKLSIAQMNRTIQWQEGNWGQLLLKKNLISGNLGKIWI
jgi:hypothetical protein